jgi:MFS family permease
VPAPWAIGVGAVLVGLGYGPITPASSHLLARTTPAHRMSLVFSIKQTGVPLGGAMAGAIVPTLQLLVGWQQALLLVGAACVLCALVAQPLRAAFDDDRNPARRLGFGNILEPVRLVFAEPALRMLAGVFGGVLHEDVAEEVVRVQPALFDAGLASPPPPFAGEPQQ